MQGKTIEGVFQHVIYSPRGDVEGALLEVSGAPAQLVFERHDEAGAEAFHGVEPGQRVVVEATPQGPSPKGDAEHAVYAFGRLASVNGRKPVRRKPAAAGAAYNGKVARFNYARHGAPNGVVLDTGDFIHTKPEGLARFKLKIGDTVAADGDAVALSTGGGYVVEATTINGKPVVHAHKPRH
jgi:hypothetical protein